jgi:superfamily II DNA or RNA helicase
LKLPSALLASLAEPNESDSDELDAEELLDPLTSSNGSLDDELLERFALPFSPRVSIQPRPFQREALRNWLSNGGRGVVVLPTGAGKTVLAFMALEQVPVRTLVVVPTIDLLEIGRAHV